MATAFKFNCLTEDIAEKLHNFETDQFVVAFCAAANPPVATNSRLADLTLINMTGMNTRLITTTSSGQSSGVYKLILADKTITMNGTATFRYPVIYNDTATGDPLICWYDYGSTLALDQATSDTFTLDFSAANGFLAYS